MKTLEDAWRWYVETKRQVILLRRLADLYWSELPWEGKLGRDDQFKELKPEQLKDHADFSLGQFDDLAVLVLFAVFESLVRDHLGAEIRAEIEEKGISHALLLSSFEDLEHQVGEGSFSGSSSHTNRAMPTWSKKSTRCDATATGSLMGGVARDPRGSAHRPPTDD